MKHTFAIHTENTPGVLHRISAIFTRRKVNIESLTVFETEQKGVSKFTIVVNQEREMVDKIIGQINKVVEVLEVSVLV